ncbi:MAG: LutC/YkgG family protein [Pararhizobium sp.]
MSGREAILNRIRGSLKTAAADDAARRHAVDERMRMAPRGVIPERGQLPTTERVALFREMAIKANATVERLTNYGAVPEAVARYLRNKNLPSEVRVGGDDRLAAAPWGAQSTLTVKHGASDGNDMVGLSHALGAVAETATLALAAGPENPTTLNFLPEHHIVVVNANDIAGDLETVWEKVRALYGKGAMPRVVNLVTGPSRSGDIEQTLLLGAHGPRALHILVVG